MLDDGNVSIEPFEWQYQNGPDDEDDGILKDGNRAIVDDPTDDTTKNKVLNLVCCRTRG